MAEIITTVLLFLAGFSAGTIIFVWFMFFVGRASDFIVETFYGED